MSEVDRLSDAELELHYPKARVLPRNRYRVQCITDDVARGPYWRVHCECGWNSSTLPFEDPDAAFHCGSLHSVLCRLGDNA